MSQLRKQCADLFTKNKQKDILQNACAQLFMEVAQIAHFVCRNDIATKMRIEQLTRHLQRKMTNNATGGRKFQKQKNIDQYQGEHYRRESTPSVYDSDESEIIMDQKFIEIRDVDAYGEVMDLQGELKVA